MSLLESLYHSIHILGQKALRYSSSLVHLIPSWLVWAEIECTMHLALLKRPINQFKPVLQSRQQALRAYCPNIYCALYICSVATFATGSALVHENNLHLYNDKYLMYHLMNFMLKGVKSIPNDRYLMKVKIQNCLLW